VIHKHGFKFSNILSARCLVPLRRGQRRRRRRGLGRGAQGRTHRPVGRLRGQRTSKVGSRTSTQPELTSPPLWPSLTLPRLQASKAPHKAFAFWLLHSGCCIQH